MWLSRSRPRATRQWRVALAVGVLGDVRLKTLKAFTRAEYRKIVETRPK
jgi:uncharacterized protein with GYD domain